MRKIYLIRHSQPDFPDEKKMCIGKTDISLGAVGRIQSVLLAEVFKKKKITEVYCSDLKRSIETASYLKKNPIQCAGLQEFDCGKWDGLPFEIIKERWPEVYQKRGEDLTYPIPGAESVEDGKNRFEQAMKTVLLESTGNIAVVGHATANKVFLCGLLGIEPKFYRTIQMDYASVTTLCVEKGITIEKQNECFTPKLNEALCQKLLQAAGTPENVQAHCLAVKEQTLKICNALKAAGILLDEELLLTSAMLHDIARTEKKHAECGGVWLTKAGYPLHGAMIASHHEIINVDIIDERAVLTIADCSVQETEVVSIEKRFSDSRRKCMTEEALKMHQKRYMNALCLKNRINTICGKEIIS